MKNSTSTPTPSRVFLWIIVAAVLSGISWIPLGSGMPLRPLMFIGLFLFLRVINGIGFQKGRYFGLIFGSILYSVALFWLYSIFSVMALALWALLAVFIAVFGMLYGGISLKYRNAVWLPIFAGVLWTSLEYFRCEWFYFRFPWITPGIAVGPTVLSPLIGVYGNTWVVVTCVAYLAGLRSMRHSWKGIIACGLVAIILSVSLSKIDESQEGQVIPIVAVQNEGCDGYNYLEQSQTSALHDGIYLWPEYSVMFPIREDQLLWKQVNDFVEERRSLVIFGTQKPSDSATPWNEALSLDLSGEVGSHYKNRPVHFMADGKQSDVAIPVQTRFGKIGTSICFDNDYTEVCRRMTANGAEMFLVPSMDAEHWGAVQHTQHAELVRLRAAETGRWFIVASTSGLTQRVDPHGNRLNSLPLMVDANLECNIYKRHNLTFYVQHGWLTPWILCGTAMIWLIILLSLQFWKIRASKNSGIHNKKNKALETMICATANVVKIKPSDKDGTETKNGTKNFRGGAKVYIVFCYTGMCDTVIVIGRHRVSGRHIELTMKFKFLENFRMTTCYNPQVIKLIRKLYEQLKIRYNANHYEYHEAEAENICEIAQSWAEALRKGNNQNDPKDSDASPY